MSRIDSDHANHPQFRLNVLILNFNRADETIECIKSLMNSDFQDFRCVIVDNGSVGNDVEHMISEFRDEVDILALDINHGIAAGWNIAIKYTIDKYNPEYILILNNDTIIEETVISELLRFADENQTVGVVGPAILTSRMPHRHQYERLQSIDVPVVDYLVSGCALLIRTEVFRSIGFFDEDYFAYGEENDFMERMRFTKWNPFYLPTIGKVYHAGAMTSSSISGFQAYYRTRNRLMFAGKNLRGNRGLNFIMSHFISWLPSEFLMDLHSNKMKERIFARVAGNLVGIYVFFLHVVKEINIRP